MKLLQDLKDLPQIKQRLADAETKLAGMVEIEQALEASLAETKVANDKFNEAAGKIATLEAEKAKLSADFEAYKAEEGKRNADYAAGLVAQVGIPPVNGKAKATETDKPDLSALKGLEKAIAANLLNHKK